MRTQDRAPGRRQAGSAKLILIIAGLIVALGATGYFGWTFRGKKISAEKDLRTALREKSDCGNDLEKARTRLADFDKNLGQARTELDTAKLGAAEADKLKKQLAILELQQVETQKRLDSFKDLTAKFQKMIDTGKINVVVRDGRMMMKLPAGILFPSGSAELSKEGQMALMEVAIILKGFDDRSFMVAGHTDNVPPAKGHKYATNWELSTARAVTVTQFLIGAGMTAKNLVAAGYGEHDPMSKTNKAENRRIEIVLLPKIEELPAMPAELAEGGGATPAPAGEK